MIPEKLRLSGRYLGPTRLRILSLIALAAQRGQPPSLREIRDVLGLASINSVAQGIERLKIKGLIQRPDRTARTISLSCRFIPAEDL